MVEKKTQGLADQLGALLYFDKNKGKKAEEVKKFEDLTDAEQAPFITQAIKFITCLDQLNKMIVPKVDPKKAQETEAKNIEILTGIIETFVKGLKTTRRTSES